MKLIRRESVTYLIGAVLVMVFAVNSLPRPVLEAQTGNPDTESPKPVENYVQQCLI
jgi:hypothetical protein